MKIGYWSERGPNKGSIRLRHELICDTLRNNGYDARLDYKRGTDRDLIFYRTGKHEPEGFDLRARYGDTPIVYDVCNYPGDYIFKKKRSSVIAQCDAVSVCSESMRKLVSAQLAEFGITKPVVLLPDAAEYPRGVPELNVDKKLKIGWFGNAIGFTGNWAEVKRDLSDKYKVEFSFLCNRPVYRDGNFIKFDHTKQEQFIKSQDIILIICDWNSQDAFHKSHNRLIDAAYCGTPVVASPLPAYMIHKEYHSIGTNYAELIDNAITNKEDTLARLRAGQDFIEKNYSPLVVGESFIRDLKEIGVLK